MKLIYALAGLLVFTVACTKKNEPKKRELPKVVDTKVTDEKDFKYIEKTYVHAVENSDAIISQRVEILVPKDTPNDATVIFHLGNESANKKETLKELFITYGRKQKIIYVQAEHRGYGQSLSNEEDQSVPAYVTKEGAIADAHTVIEDLKQTYTGKWLGMGWSYGGSLIIEMAHQHPNDFAAIYASSPLVTWPMQWDGYTEKAKLVFGEDTFEQLKNHYHNIPFETVLDEGWTDRFWITAIVRGLSQMDRMSALVGPIQQMAQLPTEQFLGALKQMDEEQLSGLITNYVQGVVKKSLTLEEAKSQLFEWRSWSYQKCADTAVFVVAEESAFPTTLDEQAEKCIAQFGIDPREQIQQTWELEEKLQNLSTPVIVYTGRRDPWAALGLGFDQQITNGEHIVTDGNHCADRDDADFASYVTEKLLEYAE